MFKSIAVALTLALGVAGCINSSWETAYTQLDASQTASWRVARVEVAAPATLTTSEVNGYVPDYDVVWHGEPYGDRRAQAAAIVRDGISRGAGVLRGGKPVVINATISQFHALTPKARAMTGNVGIHNIHYTVQVLDAATGAPLTQPQFIRAEMPGLTGDAAKQADARGYTQRAEIVNHLSKVTANWLGYGEDPRGAFNRTGR